MGKGIGKRERKVKKRKKRSDVSADEKEDEIIDRTERYLNSVFYCGTQKLKGNKMITQTCKKQMCPHCGGYKRRIHRDRYKAIMKRIKTLRNRFARYLVFTVPEELRKTYFMSKHALQSLLNIVERIIKKEFGVLIKEKKTKKGIERKYSLNKTAIATIELFGKNPSYNPHINILIFEYFKKGTSPRISAGKMDRIRQSYKRALEALLRSKLDAVNFRYSFCPKKKGAEEMDKLIWYVTKPVNRSIYENSFQRVLIDGDFTLPDLLFTGLHGFHHLRFLGRSSNSEYKKSFRETES